MAQNKDAINAKLFVEKLQTFQSDDELKKILRYFKSGKGEYSDGDKFIGVRMGQVFALSKEFMDMQPTEIKKLLESPIHEVRTGGVSIMDFRQGIKKQQKAVERNYSTCIFNATTGSITGIWLTGRPPML